MIFALFSLFSFCDAIYMYLLTYSQYPQCLICFPVHFSTFFVLVHYSDFSKLSFSLLTLLSYILLAIKLN